MKKIFKKLLHISLILLIAFSFPTLVKASEIANSISSIGYDVPFIPGQEIIVYDDGLQIKIVDGVSLQRNGMLATRTFHVGTGSFSSYGTVTVNAFGFRGFDNRGNRVIFINNTTTSVAPTNGSGLRVTNVRIGGNGTTMGIVSTDVTFRQAGLFNIGNRTFNLTIGA